MHRLRGERLRARTTEPRRRGTRLEQGLAKEQEPDAARPSGRGAPAPRTRTRRSPLAPDVSPSPCEVLAGVESQLQRRRGCLHDEHETRVLPGLEFRGPCVALHPEPAPVGPRWVPTPQVFRSLAERVGPPLREPPARTTAKPLESQRRLRQEAGSPDPQPAPEEATAGRRTPPDRRSGGCPDGRRARTPRPRRSGQRRRRLRPL